MEKDYTVKLNKNEKTFYLRGNGENLGHLIYTISDDKVMTLVGTRVDESLKGKGLGVNLIDSAIDFARKNDYKLDATCPYAVLMLDRKRDDLKDLLSEDFEA